MIVTRKNGWPAVKLKRTNMLAIKEIDSINFPLPKNQMVNMMPIIFGDKFKG